MQKLSFFSFLLIMGTSPTEFLAAGASKITLAEGFSQGEIISGRCFPVLFACPHFRLGIICRFNLETEGNRV